MKRSIRFITFLAITLIALGCMPYMVNSQEGVYTEMIAYDGSNRVQYVGKAIAGTATSATTGWQIYKLAYDGATSRVISKTWASGDPGFTHEWDERASYSYS